MSSAVHRLQKEFRELVKVGYGRPPSQPLDAQSLSVSSTLNDSLREICLYPIKDSDLFQWHGWIVGPPDTPFADFRFQLKLSVPSTYPHRPPTANFITKICHPNVHWKSGEICLDVLKDAWTPIWTLESVCRAIIALMGHPEPSSPLNCDVGNLIRAGDWKGYFTLARMYAIEHASAVKKPQSQSAAATAAVASSTSSATASSSAASSSVSTSASTAALVRAETQTVSGSVSVSPLASSPPAST